MARVLVVDDDADIVELVSLVLMRDGHVVERASTGYQAIELAERCEPDVVLLDIGLPDITGYDVARALRASPRGSTMYIAALTGWGKVEDRARSDEAGFDRHLVKPATHAMIREVLVEAALHRIG
jgi:DNA-binding response OmpR family regulator